LSSFELTEQLAPGWYHCRTDRWLAEQLANGAVQHATFEQIRTLQEGGLPPDQALAEARCALSQNELGLFHLYAGDALIRLSHAAEAEAEYRRGLAIAEEPDVKTRLLVALGGRVKDKAEKERLLMEAGALRGNLVAAAAATLALRPVAAEA
jgi:hypothetical protein